MNQKNYSRWVKNNITGNEFAEENVDYWAVFPEEDRKFNPCPTQDYKLTASFAKKLSMQQKNERGEQARNYFVGVEDKAKDLVLILKQASGDPMKLLKLHYAALEQVNKKVDEVENRVDALDKKLHDELMNLTLLGVESDTVDKALKSRGVEIAGGKESNAYHDKSLLRRIYWDLHGQLRREFGVSTYKAIKRNQTDLALKFLAEYKPPMHLMEQIENVNTQQPLDLEGGAHNA